MRLSWSARATGRDSEVRRIAVRSARVALIEPSGTHASVVGLPGSPQPLLQAGEEAVHHHLRDAAEQALADAGDGAADLDGAVDGHLGLAVRLAQGDGGAAVDEAGLAAALDGEAVGGPPETAQAQRVATS